MNSTRSIGSVSSERIQVFNYTLRYRSFSAFEGWINKFSLVWNWKAGNYSLKTNKVDFQYFIICDALILVGLLSNKTAVPVNMFTVFFVVLSYVLLVALWLLYRCGSSEMLLVVFSAYRHLRQETYVLTFKLTRVHRYEFESFCLTPAPLPHKWAGRIYDHHLSSKDVDSPLVG